MHLRAWACTARQRAAGLSTQLMAASAVRGEHMDAADSRALPSGPLRHTGASPPGVRRAPGPAVQGLLALAIYLAPFAWYALPLIRYLNMPVIGHISPDSNFYIWSMRWLPYAISHGLNPLYSNQIMAPGGISLAWSTPAPTVVIVMWPVTAAFGPVLSYNLPCCSRHRLRDGRRSSPCAD
jgi:hypothetical protein